MSNFKEGQELIIERDVAIAVHGMNGFEMDEIIEYPKGEVIEILQILEDKNYKIKFWTDEDFKVNDEPATYEFDEETIEEWLTVQVD